MPTVDPKKAKIYRRRHYLANKEKYLKKNNERRRRNVAYLREFKEASPCGDCNQSYPYYVMDLDHREGVTKDNIVSRMVQGWSLTRLQAEIDKCDLVCSNCHRERTQRRHEDKMRMKAEKAA